MIDTTLPWCCYKTTHPSGCYYTGKAKTLNVLNGTYKGSGIAFKLSLELEAYAWDTWNTVILQTFLTEDEAYDCEELLVPHSALYDPLCLNAMQGGKAGKYKTRGTLYKKLNTAKRTANKKVKADKVKAKVAALKQKIKDLK